MFIPVKFFYFYLIYYLLKVSFLALPERLLILQILTKCFILNKAKFLNNKIKPFPVILSNEIKS